MKERAVLDAWLGVIADGVRPTRIEIESRLPDGPRYAKAFEQRLCDAGVLDIQAQGPNRRGRALVDGDWTAWTDWSQWDVCEAPRARLMLAEFQVIAAADEGAVIDWKRLREAVFSGTYGRAQVNAVVQELVDAGDIAPTQPDDGYGDGGLWLVRMAGDGLDDLSGEVLIAGITGSTGAGALARAQMDAGGRPGARGGDVRQPARVLAFPEPGPAATCQWIEGDPLDGDPLDGGHVCGGATLAGKSWCLEHMARVFEVQDSRGDYVPWTPKQAVRAGRPKQVDRAAARVIEQVQYMAGMDAKTAFAGRLRRVG